MNLQAFIEIIKSLKPELKIDITENTLLTDIGLTSLDMMIIVGEVEKMNYCSIRIDSLRDNRTVGELYQKLIN